MSMKMIVILAFIAIISSITSLLLAFRSRHNLRLVIKEEDKPAKKPGLILLVGPVKASAPAAIDYHLPTLQHCWLIATENSIPTSQQLVNEYQKIIFHWGEGYIVAPDKIKPSYDVISHILDTEIAKTGLRVADIIADITGGMKPMSAGIVLGCVDHQLDMQYMKSLRDEKGEVVVGETVPIKVGIKSSRT